MKTNKFPDQRNSQRNLESVSAASKWSNVSLNVRWRYEPFACVKKHCVLRVRRFCAYTCAYIHVHIPLNRKTYSFKFNALRDNQERLLNLYVIQPFSFSFIKRIGGSKILMGYPNNGIHSSMRWYCNITLFFFISIKFLKKAIYIYIFSRYKFRFVWKKKLYLYKWVCYQTP